MFFRSRSPVPADVQLLGFRSPLATLSRRDSVTEQLARDITKAKEARDPSLSVLSVRHDPLSGIIDVSRTITVEDSKGGKPSIVKTSVLKISGVNGRFSIPRVQYRRNEDADLAAQMAARLKQILGFFNRNPVVIREAQTNHVVPELGDTSPNV